MCPLPHLIIRVSNNHGSNDHCSFTHELAPLGSIGHPTASSPNNSIFVQTDSQMEVESEKVETQSTEKINFSSKYLQMDEAYPVQ